MRTLRAVAAAVLVVLTALALGGTASAVPASAPAAAPVTAPAAESDGCTKSPDGFGLASFEAACAAHDSCYESSTSRADCDTALRENIRSACTVAYDRIADRASGRALEQLQLDAANCLGQADVYHAFVRARGASHYVGTGDPA